jgi:hypothetical protein
MQSIISSKNIRIDLFSINYDFLNNFILFEEVIKIKNIYDIIV